MSQSQCSDNGKEQAFNHTKEITNKTICKSNSSNDITGCKDTRNGYTNQNKHDTSPHSENSNFLNTAQPLSPANRLENGTSRSKSKKQNHIPKSETIQNFADCAHKVIKIKRQEKNKNLKHSKTMSDFSSLTHNEHTSEEDSFSINNSDEFKQKTLSNITKWWKGYVDSRKQKKEKADQAEEFKMRYKLKYHFMTPFQKYKMGRRPWKLALQILKILIVTSQVFLFGADRFASVLFIKNTEITLSNLFIKSYDGTESFSYYARRDVVDAIRHAHQMYETLDDISIGKFWYSNFSKESREPPLLCFSKYINKHHLGNHTHEIDHDGATSIECDNLTSTTKLNFILQKKDYFDSVALIEIKFTLNIVYRNGVQLRHLPECLETQNIIKIDNSNHDGRLRVSLNMEQQIVKRTRCPPSYSAAGLISATSAIRDVLIGFDILVIVVCSVSCLLCLRSLSKSLVLAQAAQKYFLEYRHEELTRWDLLGIINKWFTVIIISDLLSIVGSVYKIRVDERDIRFYNVCSVLLGVGVILVWVGMLRFFTYLKKYNILLITLRYAAPNLLRFMFCAMFMFFGFTFCGWIVLAPYHTKFETFLSTAECLFSLLNGDDMYPTFANMTVMSRPIWVFSKLYIYVFVSFFIYIVLSTFISIVGDTYERLKDWGRMPPTRIEVFMFPSKSNQAKSTFSATCPRCIRECNSVNIMQSTGAQSTRYGSFQRSLSSSQLSVVSASLE